MTSLNLDREKCAQRRRIAARRDGVDATPVKFIRGDALQANGKTIATDGWLPANDQEALARINELLPANAEPLKGSDVYIHYIEAANGSFIADRYAFIGERTLRNMAQRALAGFSFMNSHRTGGLSSDAELPYGKTFSGRFEMTDGGSVGPSMRTVVGFYMLKGQHPNGASGPSTDSIHAQIVGGTIIDVSVGLWGGETVCDVCGAGLYERDEDGYYLCPHVPGTHRAMSDDQRVAQESRGVTKGRASYTIDDAHTGEVSAVYDGAVDGAGFRKVLAFSRALSSSDMAEAREAFASLFGNTKGIANHEEEPMAASVEIKPGDPNTELAQESKEALSLFQQLANLFRGSGVGNKASDDPEKAELRRQLSEERASRAKLETDAVLGRNKLKFNPIAKKRFEALLTRVQLEPGATAKDLDLVTELSALADELPQPLDAGRLARNANEANAAADTVIDSAESITLSGDAEALESRSLDVKVRAYMASNKMEYSTENYQKALQSVLAESRTAA